MTLLIVNQPVMEILIVLFFQDPAGPYFEGTPPSVRLDKTDANFVDIIHSDSYKLVANTTSIGILNPIGHVNY